MESPDQAVTSPIQGAGEVATEPVNQVADIAQNPENIPAAVPTPDTSFCLLLASCGSFFSITGLVLMKYAHLRRELKGSTRPIFCSFLWLIGVCSLVTGAGFNVVAVTVGNQFLVSSTCSLSIIFNSLYSVILLKERFFPSDFIALIFLSIGCTLFMVSGKNSDKVYDDTDLKRLFTREAALYYNAICFSYVLFSYCYSHFVIKRIRTLREEAMTTENQEQVFENEQAVDNTAQSLLMNKNYEVKFNVLVLVIMIISHMPNRYKFISRDTVRLSKKIKKPLILLAIVTGLAGALILSYMRGLTIAINNPEGIANPLPIFFMIAVFCFAALQLGTLTRLQWLYEQIQIQPIFETSLIIFNMSSGCMLMKDYELYTEVEFMKMCGYMFICILGVIMLVFKIDWFNHCINKKNFDNVLHHDPEMEQFKYLDQEDRDYLKDQICKIEDADEQRQLHTTIMLVFNMEKEKMQLK